MLRSEPQTVRTNRVITEEAGGFQGKAPQPFVAASRALAVVASERLAPETATASEALVMLEPMVELSGTALDDHSVSTDDPVEPLRGLNAGTPKVSPSVCNDTLVTFGQAMDPSDSLSGSVSPDHSPSFESDDAKPEVVATNHPAISSWEGFVAASALVTKFPPFELPENWVQSTVRETQNSSVGQRVSVPAVDNGVDSVDLVGNAWTGDGIKPLSTILGPITTCTPEMVSENKGDAKTTQRPSGSGFSFANSVQFLKSIAGFRTSIYTSNPQMERPNLPSFGPNAYPSSQSASPSPARGGRSFVQDYSDSPDYSSDRAFAERFFTSWAPLGPLLYEGHAAPRSPTPQTSVHPSSNTTPVMSQNIVAPMQTRGSSDSMHSATLSQTSAPARPAKAVVREVLPSSYTDIPLITPTLVSPLSGPPMVHHPVKPPRPVVCPGLARGTLKSMWARTPDPDSKGFDARSTRRMRK